MIKKEPYQDQSMPWLSEKVSKCIEEFTNNYHKLSSDSQWRRQLILQASGEINQKYIN